MSVLDIEASPKAQAKTPVSRPAPVIVRIIEPKSTTLSTVLIVLLLTIVGGVLRFAWLDKPTLWGDDALTYLKVAGTYREMLGELHRQGFGPLHYELYWWMRQQTILTPVMMRLVPSLCGTLMIPAMYFLAIQLVNRRAALIATLFTAVSAYMLNYARDAKMYAELWFFATLSMACFLWWLRARTPLSWLCWVAVTIAMVGIQLLGFAAVGIELIIVLTAPRQNWSGYIYLPITALWLVVLTIVALVSFPIACVLGILYLALLAFRRVRSRYSPTPLEPGRTIHLDVLTSILWPLRWTAIGAGILLFVAYRQGQLFPLINLPLAIWNALTAEYSASTHNPFSSWLAIGVLAVALTLISFLVPRFTRKISVLTGILIVLVCTMRIGSTTALVLLGTATLIYGIVTWAIGHDWLAEGVAFAPRFSAARPNRIMYGLARRVTFPAILLFAIGVGISSFSILHAYAFNSEVNSFVQNAVDDGQPDGLGWIPPYNFGRRGLDYIQYTATAWLYKWEWPKNYPALGIKDFEQIDPGTYRLLVASAYAFVGIAFLSLLPWSRRLTHESQPLPTIAGRTRWRRALWVSVSLVMLPYGMFAYCMPRTESPVEWFFELTQTVDAPTLARPEVPKFTSTASANTKITAPDPVTTAVSTWQSIRDGFAAVATFFVTLWDWIGVLWDYLKTWVPYWSKVSAALSWQTTRWKTVLALLVGGIIYSLMAERTLLAAVKRFVGGVGIVVGLAAVCMLVAAALPRPLARFDIWYPRYVAISWPAFAIVVSVLLARLPHKSIRWLAVTLLVAVNLGMHAARVFAGTEPRVDLMVVDQLAAAAPQSHTKFFYDGPRNGAPPGTATLADVVGTYYRTILTGGANMAPMDFRRGGRQNNLPGTGNGNGNNQRPRGFGEMFQGGRRGGGGGFDSGSPSQNAAEANQSRDTQRVISWDFMQPNRVDLTDALGDALGGQWRKVSDDLYATREHWTMRDFGSYRRREYVRRPVEAPALPVAPVNPPPAPEKPTPTQPKPAQTRPTTRPTPSLTPQQAARAAAAATKPANNPATKPAVKPTPVTRPAPVAPPTTSPVPAATTAAVIGPVIPVAPTTHAAPAATLPVAPATVPPPPAPATLPVAAAPVTPPSVPATLPTAPVITVTPTPPTTLPTTAPATRPS